MERKNEIASIAYKVGIISFVVVVCYVFISLIGVLEMFDNGYGEEAIMSLPLRIGILICGLAETGICFVISEIVQLLDDSSKCLSKCVSYLKNSQNKDSTENLYSEELPEL